MVEAVERCFRRSVIAIGVAIGSTVCVAVGITIRVAVGLALECGLAVVICLVASIYSFSIASDGEMAIDDRILAGQIWLIEVVGMDNIAATETWIHDNGSVWANKHSNAASTASRASVALLVQSNVASYDNCIPAVPSRRLHPVYSVEESISATIAGIDSVNALNVCVTGRFEELH